VPLLPRQGVGDVLVRGFLPGVEHHRHGASYRRREQHDVRLHDRGERVDAGDVGDVTPRFEEHLEQTPLATIHRTLHRSKRPAAIQVRPSRQADQPKAKSTATSPICTAATITFAGVAMGR
jgi:hypothetical protein